MKHYFGILYIIVHDQSHLQLNDTEPLRCRYQFKEFRTVCLPLAL